MKNILNKRIKLLIAAIVFIIIINIAISFAYLRGTTVDSESKSTVALMGGRVYVKYTGNTSNIIVNDIVPGFETTKQFTVTSEFGNNHEYYKDGVWYTIALVVDKNEFDNGSIICSLTANDTSDNDGDLAPSSVVPLASGENLNGINLGSGRFENDNKSHTYTLKISYPESGSNQSHMVNAEFNAHVILTNPQLINITFNLDGGSFENISLINDTSLKVPANSVINLPIPNKEGYIFAGWEVVSGNVSTNSNVISTGNGDISIKALWNDNVPYEFAYTGGEQQFIAEISGYYKIETWGGQGGNSLKNGVESGIGGYGGYSTGTLILKKDDILYVCVGGKGGDGKINILETPGGYNGGGISHWDNNDNEASGGGGGATHIAKSLGLLSTFENKTDELYIVSGAGGGALWDVNGGSGGGQSGNTGVITDSNGTYYSNGGTQLSGYKFGIGEDGKILSTSPDGGGGAGFYGGNIGVGRTNDGTPGGGGSGYIGNPLLTNKYMYCYNCATSDVESTKTYTTTCAEETPTENCAKKANGYARITYLHS